MRPWQHVSLDPSLVLTSTLSVFINFWSSLEAIYQLLSE